MILLLAGTMSVFAQNKTEKFKVRGACDMCESRIEKAALSVDGVSKAEWDKASLMLTVTYKQDKTDNKKIQSAIAKVGHDTELYRADDAVYAALPGCCKYERAAATATKIKTCCSTPCTSSCGK